jgi:hypothetical protein
VNLLRLGARHIVEFNPKDVGPHTVNIECAGQPIVGSPYTANAYDLTKVHILDPPTSGIVGNDMSVTGDFLALIGSNNYTIWTQLYAYL